MDDGVSAHYQLSCIYCGYTQAIHETNSFMDLFNEPVNLVLV